MSPKKIGASAPLVSSVAAAEKSPVSVRPAPLMKSARSSASSRITGGVGIAQVAQAEHARISNRPEPWSCGEGMSRDVVTRERGKITIATDAPDTQR